MNLLDHPLVSQRYFFPRADAPRDVVQVPVDGATLACSVHRAGKGRPMLLHFHGNGEVVADYVPGAPARLASLGIDSFFAEYRGYGASTGVPQLARMLDDVERVLEATGAEPGKLFVYGRSIGSIFAIEAVRRWPQIGGLILESGIADVHERVLLRVRPEELGVSAERLRDEVRRCFDHEAKLSAYDGRVLVLHAAHDTTVDPSHAERNARWAKRSERVVFDRGDHNTILAANCDAILEAVHRFVVGGAA